MIGKCSGIRAAVLGATLAAAVFAAQPAKAAGDLVVLAAEGTTVAPGTVLSGDGAFSIPAGAAVTLIGADGNVFTLDGPYSGTPGTLVLGTPRPETVSVLADLIVASGAVRSLGEGDLPDPWAMSVETSGRRCVSPDRAMLYRRVADGAARVKIVPKGAGRKAYSRWKAGEATLDVPPQMFEDGGDYLVDVGGTPVQLTTHKVPTGLRNPVDQAVWMAKAGCAGQAMTLLNGLK